MRHKILSITSHPDPIVQQLIAGYAERINHYAPCACIDGRIKKKTADREKQIEWETAWFEENILPEDTLLLLDERGKITTSEGLAQLIQKLQNGGAKGCVSIIGGAFGVGEALKRKAHHTISLSGFTLPHQLARLVWVEQVYRAYTILHNEKYHHI